MAASASRHANHGSMKKFPSKIIFILLSVVAAIIVLWPRSQSPIDRSLGNPSLTADAKNKVTMSPPNSNAAVQFALERVKKMRAILETENVPIVFWGKIVDETNAGVSGAMIKYHVRGAGVLNAAGLVEDKNRNGVVSSGIDGSFEIRQSKGMSLAIEDITKPGYRLYENQKLVFSYTVTSSLHKPDKQSPQTYVMRSSESRMDVRWWEKKVKLPWNNGEIRFDLQTGNLSPSGNLVFTASRNGSFGRFDWNLTVTLQNGELSEAKENTALIAPENGYLPKWQCGFLANDKDFLSSLDTNVYYRVNGKYGRLKFLIYADAGPNDVSLYLESFANNSDGRNTEGR
jgi:hypothetical protein